ncbi:MAG: 23S rRNA (uracil(1939)-C(5))-methyltransferase RlmD [Prevotella sp.]|nr:23S rRNA (uracil(1939)-C(5))-methyltransferase RlmD [Prevotella sp.]
MKGKRQTYERVTITDIAAEGKALCRVGEMVVFVPWAVPGDVVDLEVTRKKHSFCEAKIIKFHEASPLRIPPRCAHFGICGGCRWQQLPYSEQLKAKQRQVSDQLSRIGKVSLPDVNTILGSEKEYEYRNKLEFGFSNKRWLTEEEILSGEEIKDLCAAGFHISGAFDKIYPIERCHLMEPLNNDIRNAVRDYAIAHDLSFYDLRLNCGLLRDMVIRNSNTGEWMLIMQFRFSEKGDEEKAMALLGYIGDRFPQITSLLYVDNQKCNDTFADLPVHVFKGADHIFELMGDLRFKVGPKSFYQTNTEQAHRLYNVVKEFAHLTGSELVYDLYTGTGTIACFVARSARRVVGIEYVSEAIEDARVNAEINGIANAEFFAGDMKDILTAEFIAAHGTPDVIITDPPRAGMHPDVVNVLLRALPSRIVYVSCNPATQARDLQLLDGYYAVKAVQPVDMFPHTPHVENVVLLVKR